MIKWFCILLIFEELLAQDFHVTIDEIQEEINKKQIYYGSTVRIEHQTSKYFLHSHLVSYGSGSGQQSVTGMQADHDYNSLWTIKECYNQPLKKYDDQIKCGDCIRLEHMLTNRNLHSHPHQAPFSGNQEVSAYGDNGNGDTSDDWILECIDNKNGDHFQASMWFYLKHKLTQKYLRSNKKDNFNQRNCGYHCPIEGQLEISAQSTKNADAKWKIHSGLFYQQPQQIEDDYEQDGRHCNTYGQCDDIDDDEFETVVQKDL
ncbi:unnamed protein product [Paramecium primaurelia]|uniref:MIR domain-containing protein n=1 Tax=Paramecium primaurelia TaxID=5886 RepID=A0A8S1KSU9_PARPR|nr:unnamed protein product [Paramecium primaurelia]